MARITDERVMRRRAAELAHKEWETFMENKLSYTEESMRQLIEEPRKWMNARCRINYEAHVEKNKEFERVRLRNKSRREYLRRNVKQCHTSDFTKAEKTFLDEGKKQPEEEVEPYDFYSAINSNRRGSYNHSGDGPSCIKEYHCEVLSSVIEHDPDAEQTIEWAMRDIDSGPMLTSHISMWDNSCPTAWRQDAWENMFL
jgi:hypothetical protein